MYRKIILLALVSLSMSSLTQCGCSSGSSKSAPVLSDLVITSTDETSITLAEPTFTNTGDPAPSIVAYIGVDGTISVSGSTVTGSFQGPVDLSPGGEYTFNGLSYNTLYRIVVVARNSKGYSMKEIAQSTGEIRPVMNDLVITGASIKSISIAQPTFSIAGNPLPAVSAYIGIEGQISVSGSIVKGSLQGPVDVSAGGYTFSDLNFGTTYRIIVVAENIIGSNIIGYSVKQITKGLVNTTAQRVYGQYGSFTSSGRNIGPGGLCMPRLLAVDANGIYVSDSYNSRVLYFEGSNTTPSRVYGQGGSYTSSVENRGGVSAESLKYPSGIAVSSSGVYITDMGNHRVLFYPGTSTSATRVYGQGGSFISNSANNGGISENSLNNPFSVKVSSTGVYIADRGNNRILYYSGSSTTASLVYGQGGDFTSNTTNRGGVSADSLNSPGDMEVVSGGLYIADSNNNRILYYPGTSTTATRVYGQGGVFDTGYYNKDGISADSLTQVFGILADSTGLYATDWANSRVLYYEGESTTATVVYGQGGSFTSGDSNNGGVSADSIDGPMGVALYGGSLVISDTFNNRVLYYEGGSTTAVRVYGQNGSFITNIQNNDGVTADILRFPSGIATNDIGVYISDTVNHRVLYYEGSGTTAVRVYGQNGSFSSNIPNLGGSISAGTLYSPHGVAADSGGVYIADYMNSRVLYYEGTDTTASRVYGQGGSFTANDTSFINLSADTLINPTAVAVDSSGVYIADTYNNRVLYYEGTSTTATRVYGQGGSFTTNTANNGGISADSLWLPWGIAVYGDCVYIADTQNSRVLCYEGTSTTATRVYGQGGSFTTSTPNNGGVSADSLDSPQGVSVDMYGVYIADTNNNRVLFYPGKSTTATRVYGQSGSLTANMANSGGVSSDSLYVPYTLCAGASGLFIADSYNNRVLWY